MFESLGRAAFRWRWPVIAAWAVVFLLGLSLLPSLPGRLKPGGFFDPSLESQQAQEVVERELGLRSAALVVIFHHPQWQADDPEYAAQVERALAPVRALPVVEEVIPPRLNPRQVGADGHTSFAVVTLAGDDSSTLAHLDEVSRAIPPVPLRTIVAGGPVVYRDIQEVSERDLRRAELISFPLAMVVLVLVFGSLIAAGIPVAIGGLSVGIALAVVALLAGVTDLSIFVLNLSTMLGLGLGTDYSLFVVTRFREELAESPVETAIVRTMATAGRAVFFSGLTVFIGLLGLASMRFMMLRSLGIAGAVVVLLALLAALTLLPAILSVLGDRVNALPVLRATNPQAALWVRVAALVMARPWVVVALVLALLAVLGAPFLRARFSLADASVLPRDMPSRQVYDLMREQFGDGESAKIGLVVRSPGPILRPDRLDAIFDLSRAIAGDPEVSRVESIVDLDPRLTREQYQLIYREDGRWADAFARAALQRSTRDRVTILGVVPKHVAVAPEATALVDRLRTYRPGADLELLVGGGPAMVDDIVDRLYGDFPRAILFIVATTYLTLLALLRSVVVPLKAIVMNSLSLLASYGALVVVFQEGFLAGPLGFSPLGYVEATLPVIMFCLLFGLSMDYEVFLLTRVKEAYDTGASNIASVGLGLQQSGRVITNAALIVVVVSLSFASAEVILIKALGLGTAIAVLLDATVIRALLVPATLRLLGDLNWWAPESLRRVLARGPVGE
ncbi:MAG: MMPL family transporter [Chloroflexi bacterium]|nr:MMPL family transporter [Chloroflexota bacterium]